MFHSYRLDTSRSDTFQWNFWEATSRYDSPIDKTKDTVPEQTSWAANIDRGEGSCREPMREMISLDFGCFSFEFMEVVEESRAIY